MDAKVFLITGCSRGLGRALARAVLAEGHRLVATARAASSVADLVAASGGRAVAVSLDVTDADAARAAVAAAQREFGRLDVVVNNAGYANLVALEDSTLADFTAQIATNFFGVVNVTKAALPVLRAAGGGHIVNVSSVGGRLGTPGLAAYQSAKWAVGGLSEVLAAELAPLGIRVTAVEPGGMTTDWAGSSMTIPPVSEAYQPTVGVLARLFADTGSVPAGDPAKVAQAVLTIVASPEPPVRVLLGSDALAGAERAARARADEDAKWRWLALRTDRDDATDQERDPLATAE